MLQRLSLFGISIVYKKTDILLQWLFSNACDFNNFVIFIVKMIYSFEKYSIKKKDLIKSIQFVYR